MSVFAPLLGQLQAVELLNHVVAKNHIAPAYLFAGPSGVGRSFAAECFRELLLQPVTQDSSTALSSRIQQRNHPDLLWVEPTYLHQGKRLTAAAAISAGVKRKSAPLIRLEQIREVIQFLSRTPVEAARSVVVLEQAETMPEAAANALLKTLEEPGQATLILIAPGIESLLPTLVSRCQRIPFYRLPAETMAQVLQQTGQAEILQHPEVLMLAQGSPGQAIAHWHQLQEIPPELLQSLTQLPNSPQAAMHLARQIDKLETEMQLWLVDYLQQSYWQGQCSELSHLTTTRLNPLQLLETARQHLQHYVQPRLVWEVTLLGMVQT
jgi:DNA polymerase-3 subunit delta'